MDDRGYEQPFSSTLKFLLISLIVLQSLGLLSALFGLVKSFSPTNAYEEILQAPWMAVVTIVGKGLAIAGGVIMLNQKAWSGFHLYLAGKVLSFAVPTVFNLIYFDTMLEYLQMAFAESGLNVTPDLISGVFIGFTILGLIFTSLWPILIFNRRSEFPG
jgi:hypothetical protein